MGEGKIQSKSGGNFPLPLDEITLIGIVSKM
jgi:hypothetical protein